MKPVFSHHRPRHVNARIQVRKNLMLRGRVYGYIPDYFIRLEKGNMLILEVKGNEPDEEKSEEIISARMGRDCK